LDYYQFSKSEYRAIGNLLFLNSAGEIKWTAETPTPSDSYIDFHNQGRKIHATSWDGYFVEIDPCEWENPQQNPRPLTRFSSLSWQS